MAQTPAYQPFLTPQQQMQLSQGINQFGGSGPQQGPTYAQWLASQGYTPEQIQQKLAQQSGQPMQTQPLQTPSSNIDIGKLIASFSSGGAAGGAANSVGPLATPPLANTTLGAMQNAGLTSGATDLGASGVPETAAAPGMFSLSGIGGAGNGILPLAGAAGAYDLFKNNRTGIRGIGQGAASGAALGSYFGPWGIGIGAGVGGLAGLASGMLNHKTTQQYEADKWGDIANKAQSAGIDPNVMQAIQLANHPTGDTGKGYDFNGILNKVKGGSQDFNLVAGNLSTFGPDFIKLSPQQQAAVSQQIAQAGLYGTDKGDVVITDPNKANQIYQSVSQGGFKPPAMQFQNGTPNPVPRGPTPTLQPGGQISNLLSNGPLMIPQSSPAHRPGFSDTTGQRINYGK